MGVGTVLVAALITSLISWVLYNHTVNLLTENLKARLLSIVTTAVVQFDSEDIEALKTEKDWKSPHWRRVVTQLKKVKDNNNDIIFAYIFRYKPGSENELEFVADAESIDPYANSDDNPENDIDVDHNGIIDSIDYLQWPGQEYPEPPEDAYKAFSGPLTNEQLYADAWGQVITGYAPIKNERGFPIAVLAVDIRATDFFTITQQTFFPFLSFIVLLIGVICILAWMLIRIWDRQVKMVEELDRQKDELLSIVSHQLATPVSSIKWYVEMLLDGDLGKLTKDQSENLATIQNVAATLSDLVSMILDVSRVQLGKMKVDRAELDLDQFFKEVIDTIEPRAKEKKINFEVKKESLGMAILDKRLTRMTLENLLTNAIKYTPESGRVTVHAEVKNGELLYQINDTGLGIPKNEQSKIFGKLFRASNARNKIEGNGFGLYVAKGAVEAQKGQIWFDSQEGKGTKFFVVLPIS